MNPLGRIGLYVANKVIEAVFRFRADQQMGMILYATDLQWDRIETLNDTA